MFVILCILTTSCISGRNTSYRVLNKNGKVVYFERKKPLYNDKMRTNEKELTNIQNINKTLKDTKINNQITNKKTAGIPDNLVLDSSAYTLRSVVDTVVKDDDIEYLAKVIDKNKKVKTIKDFDIPEHYFNSSVKNQSASKKLQIEQAKRIELENQINQQEYGLFARIFGGNRNKTANDLKPVKKETKIKKMIEIENDKNQQEYGLFARIFGGNRNKTVNDVKVGQQEMQQNKTSNIKTGKVVINNNQQRGKSKNSNYARSNNTNNQLNVVSKATNNNRVVSSVTSNNTSNNIKSSYLQSGKYYIQLGSFIDKNKANRLMAKFNDVGDGGAVVPINVKGKIMYKVAIGTFSSKAIAEKEMEQVLERGHFDCYVFRK